MCLCVCVHVCVCVCSQAVAVELRCHATALILVIGKAQFRRAMLSCDSSCSPFSNISNGEVFLSLADLRKAHCQLLVNECALSNGKLSLGGLPRNSMVK